MNLILIGTIAEPFGGTGHVFWGRVILFVHRISEKVLDTAMGFAAGVMLAAILFGLQAPAIAIGEYIYV